ncbi:hypothetical protein HaLaN_28290 [Haematococcus lacustris]|uniref:Uncharacterized protein n=1 Tax=Haematococcus lacustris TaxID=44745 RepID=A0A6A0AAI9_HAELA|nr:hypothetical protein HaLaN_28290 [Haematococcus lacustris]
MSSISSVHRASRCGLQPLRSSGALHVLRATTFRPKAAEKEPPSQVATASGTRQQSSPGLAGVSCLTRQLRAPSADVPIAVAPIPPAFPLTDNKATAGDMLKRSLQLAGGAAALLLMLVLAFLFSNGLL